MVLKTLILARNAFSTAEFYSNLGVAGGSLRTFSKL